MNIRVIYDNGNYETFDTTSMPFDNGGYLVENSYLRFNDMLAAPSEGEMRLTLERSYWSVDRSEGDGNGGYRVDVPTELLDAEALQGVLAIIVDGMCMVARCEGRLRHWLDPLFENPVSVGFDVERMTGGWQWPSNTMSVSRPEGGSFRMEPTGLAPRTAVDGSDASPSAHATADVAEGAEMVTIDAPSGSAEECAALEELYPGINDDDADGDFVDDAL